MTSVEPSFNVMDGLGAKLRHARRMKSLRLKDVAERVGCSESLLSKIELDRSSPTLQTLHKLAEALGTSVAALFAAEKSSAIVIYRAGERPSLYLGSNDAESATRLERMTPYAEGRVLNANLHVVPPGGGSEGIIAHPGEEVGYVIAGYVEIEVDGEVFVLNEGTSFFFQSHLPHRYRNVGTEPARILWVNTPPY